MCQIIAHPEWIFFNKMNQPWKHRHKIDISLRNINSTKKFERLLCYTHLNNCKDFAGFPSVIPSFIEINILYCWLCGFLSSLWIQKKPKKPRQIRLNNTINSQTCDLENRWLKTETVCRGVKLCLLGLVIRFLVLRDICSVYDPMTQI